MVFFVRSRVLWVDGNKDHEGQPCSCLIIDILRMYHLLLHDLVQPQEGSSGGTSQAMISSNRNIRLELENRLL